MNLWQSFEKTRCKLEDRGISLHFEKGIERELRALYLDFTGWLRRNYVFPVHLTVYILDREKVRLRNGALSYGSFRWYAGRSPSIRIPSKIEADLLKECSLDEIYEMILSSFVHELTHYYQWALELDQSSAVSERQANYYRYRLIERYKKEKES